MTLLDVLREECGVVSAKSGCAPEGACGCCLVNIDGKPALSCLRKPEQMNGHAITTLEGLPEERRKVISESFVLEGGVQCGFCIPGIVMRAAHLIDQGKTGDRDAIAKALDGHICRCTGYGRILDAIQTAGEVANGAALPKEPRRHFYFGEQFGRQRNPEFARPANGEGGEGNGKRSKSGIGQPVARLGGLAQVLGEKAFIDDMRVPGMLHGAMVPTEHPRARILKIDTSEAEQMPGVVRVFTAKDVPGVRGTGMSDPDLPVFVAEGELTCCVADFLAMVVADTQWHARQAAKAVKIEYEVLEPITDPFDALKPGAPLVHSAETSTPRFSNILEEPTSFSRGNLDEQFAKSDHVMTATFQTQPIDIAFLEPEACLAIPQGKGVKVHTQSQGSVYDHDQLAQVLALDPADVEVALSASGGAFGAKEDLSIQAQTAIAAYVLQRPVKTVLTREESTRHHVKRHAMTLTYTVGFDNQGHLMALKADIVADAGGYHSTSAKCALRAAGHACGIYRVPAVAVDAKAVYTNNPNAGAMRGFGSNQAQFAMEGMMDLIAERVGIDGWDVRDRNICNPGDQYGTGQIMRESVRGARETLNAVKDVYKSAKYKGIGCGVKSTGLGNGTIEGGYIKIHVLPPSNASAGQARIEILNGFTEMGQGIYTATAQVVCEETGIAPELVSVTWDAELGEKCGETWASRGTTLSCAAAARASRQLVEDLKTHTLEQLVGKKYYDEVVYDITTRPGTPEAKINPTTHLTFSYATQVVILDDDGQIARIVVANDVGRAINPRLCAEQMEGGAHMGIGYALSEDFPSANGIPDSLGLRDMGIVPAKYMPPVDIILIEVPDEIGGYGAKGVGEIGCVATPPAIAGALHSYDGIRRFRLPMQDARAAAPMLPKSRRGKPQAPPPIPVGIRDAR
jgi:xanthine dehydrogenase molybdenum-binding subunit